MKKKENTHLQFQNSRSVLLLNIIWKMWGARAALGTCCWTKITANRWGNEKEQMTELEIVGVPASANLVMLKYQQTISKEN